MIRSTILTAVLLASPAGAQTAGDANRGHALFMTDGCYECHGTVGQGGPGSRVAPEPLPAAAIAAYIRNPTGEMPPFTSKVVSDADVRDIHAYLATVSEPPKVASIPELK
jgi:mono/diheme cytochrome c family protein